jgi:hypothetical protein
MTHYKRALLIGFISAVVVGVMTIDTGFAGIIGMFAFLVATSIAIKT